MKKMFAVVTIINVLLIFTSCHKSTYLPQEDITLNTEQATPSMDTTGKLSYDPCAYRAMREYTGNGVELYFLNGEIQYRVDLENETYSYLCTQLECEHNDTDCEMYDSKTGIRCYRDGVLYANDNSLYYRESDGNTTELFTNKATTDYANEFGDNPYAINGMIFIDQENLLLLGYNYFYIFNLTTQEAGEIIEVTDSSYSVCTYLNGKVYTSVNGGELYVTELSTGKSQKLADQGINVKAYGDRILYCKWNKGVCSMYSNNQQFDDEKMLVEDSGPMFYVFDDVIFYDKNNVIYMYEGGEASCLCDTNAIEYEYSLLPVEYQNDDVNMPNAKLSWLYNYYYYQDNLIMELNFEVYDVNDYPRTHTAVYMLDENGDMRELEMR